MEGGLTEIDDEAETTSTTGGVMEFPKVGELPLEAI